MKRLFVLVACLALVSAAACRKSADPAAGAPAAQPAAAAPAGGPSASPAATPAEPKKIEITDDLIKKYMEYQNENMALVQQFAEQTRKNLESAKGDTVKTLNQISINEKLSNEMDEKLKAKRKALGLGDEEFEVVKDGAQMIATARALYNQMGGDAQLAKMEAEQKVRIEKLPTDQRAAAAAQMADMTKSFHDIRDGLDMRKKYGDASADALLRHADELAKQYWDAMKTVAGKK